MERKHRVMFAVGEGGGPQGPDFTTGSLEAREKRLDLWYNHWPELDIVFGQISDSRSDEAVEILRNIAEKKESELAGVKKNTSPETAQSFTLKNLVRAAYFAIDEGKMDVAERLRDEVQAYLQQHLGIVKGELDLTLRHVARSAEYHGLHRDENEEALWSLFGLTKAV